MKISRIQNQNIVNNIYKDNERKTNEKDEKTTKAVDIEISDSAKKLTSRINTASNVDYSEKVEKIRKQILEGVYKVEPEKIADKIISSMDKQKEREINE
ncbi:MAG TPA: flagellar biosynthesis anti-sigma factor FlgM [Soehngenia sp.]|nr:flagellar biosynthesis anti-sigma factor FlgM [Soehngenia sp.]HPP31400.1 flagellar biosynthesis anti-sigma factor FlgM [Soehngenia sp.]